MLNSFHVHFIINIEVVGVPLTKSKTGTESAAMKETKAV